MIKTIEEILVRDLNSLKNEILAFKSNEDLWVLKGEIKNSAGTLSQHLCGNLKHFIGATIGMTGYIRNRDLEFSETGLKKEELIKNIEESIAVIKSSILKLNSDDLDKVYKLPFLGKEVTNGELLLILQSHLAYHLGQINYLRRIL
jgi:DNA recombination-dependent growth factor C